MKITINKRLKITLLVINSIALITTSIFLYRAYTVPQYAEEQASLYNYSNKTGINYNVFLRPNVLYEEENIGEGKTYITEFIDRIQATFHYNFSGEREADIRGNYEIVAEVEGYTGQAETYKTIWKKENILLPKKGFQDKGKTVFIEESYSLDIHGFNEFSRNVIEVSKISSSVKLTVFMKVDVEVMTDQGAVVEEITSSMIIPLNTNYFEITGSLTNEKPNSIQETIQVQLPVDKKKIILYGGIIGLLLIILIFLSFFTKGIEKKSPLEKKLKQIFKKHGDRLVALNTGIKITSGCYSEVKSIEDLVRIADELGKPIMYKYSTNHEEISKFYVLDETKVFLLDIHKMLTKSNLNNVETEKRLTDHESTLKDITPEDHESTLKDITPEDHESSGEGEIKESDNL